MSGSTGYFFAFAMLIAAGIVGVVVMPAARRWDMGGYRVDAHWFAVPARA